MGLRKWIEIDIGKEACERMDLHFLTILTIFSRLNVSAWCKKKHQGGLLLIPLLLLWNFSPLKQGNIHFKKIRLQQFWHVISKWILIPNVVNSNPWSRLVLGIKQKYSYAQKLKRLDRLLCSIVLNIGKEICILLVL